MLKFRIIGKQTMLWHQAQWKIASNSVSDVIILTWDLHYLSLLPALFRAKLNKVPVILWGHGFSKNENKFKLILDSRTPLNEGNVFVFINQIYYLSLNVSFNKKKIFVAPNSLDQTPIIEAKKYWSTKLKKLRKTQNIT